MRSYKQFCGVAKALDLVGERWTLLLVRELLLGGRRYGDLLAALPGLTTNLLAKRLKHLQSHGLIAKRKLPPPAGSTVYELTAHGRELEPVVFALGNFGEAMLELGGDDRMDFRWLCVSLQRRFSDDDPTGIRVQLDHLGVRAVAHWDGERLRVTDGSAPADVTLSGSALPGVLVHRAPLDAAQIDGERTVAARLVAGLRLPR